MLLSKLNVVSTGATSSTRVIPTIQIVQIPSPQIFKTDPANFLALVQKLTGKKPAPKKLTGTVGSKKKMKKSIVRSKYAANHSHALAVVDENYFPKQVSEKKYHVGAPLVPIEEDGVQVCDSFSELFCDLDKLDFLNFPRVVLL
ncbi:hypothetical protein SUGI_0422370 [Cryptomeria japonica]|nr:hypothetical protein SUGI_0422370 [Cryptomeria japonica]